MGGGRATRSAPRLGRGRAFLRPAKRLYRLRTGNGRILPSAIVIGAQKCGTSALYHYLSRHPAIGSAGTKEVHYFDQRYDQGVAWYRSHFPTARAARRLAASGDASQPIAIEASPYYLAHPLVPYRIRGLIPDARLLVLLRDPVDRAISHHNHEVEDGNETLSFTEAIEVEGERLRGEAERLLATPLYRSFNHQHYSYLLRGRYAEQLEVWFSLFGRERFLILDSASLFADPGATVCRVCEFLGIPPPPPLRYRPIGARSYRGLDAHSRARLEQYFAPHNARLWELLGEEFSWS